MEPLWEWPYRLYPAVAMILGGFAIAARGDFLLVRAARKPIGTPGKNYTWIRGFRMALFGGSLAAVGAGWLWDIPALAVAGLAIGFEETLETSICAYALKQSGD
jgi:hypothetical protein